MQSSRSKTPVFSISKGAPPTTPSDASKPQLESSVYKDLMSALSILPHRRTQSSPAKTPTTAASSSSAPRRLGLSSFFSSKSPKSPVAAAPAPSHASSSLRHNKASLPAARPPPTIPPPLPPKSAPATRPITPATSKPLPPIHDHYARPATSAAILSPHSGRSQSTSPVPSFALPTAASQARAAARPKIERSKTNPNALEPPPLKPRAPARAIPPTSPPSAFPLKPAPRSLPRKRSKTFPDPSDPNPPQPPPSVSHTISTATRILEAFDPSPRVNSPELPTSPRSPSVLSSTASTRSKATPPRTLTKEPRVIPRAAAAVTPTNGHTRTASYSKQSTSPVPRALGPSSAPPGRSSFETSRKVIPVIPAKITPVQGDQQANRPAPTKVIPVIPARTEPNPARRLARPTLRPLQTTSYASPSSPPPPVLRGTSPITPETQPSSESPKTPAAFTEPTYMTSDDEGSRSSNKRTLKNFLRRKQRPDSINSSGTFGSFFSGSGSSNGSTAVTAPSRSVNGRRTPGGLTNWEEEDEKFAARTETRHGIRRHAHPPAEVPYPVSFEEMVLQGEKHTQDLLSLVMNQKAYRFTAIDNFSKLRNILDLGCGRGYWLTDAARECKQANLVGFDIVDVFLSQAEMRDKRGLSESQISRIEFVRGNFFSALPFANAQFDYIRLAFLELAIPESKWTSVLLEAWRVLKPGGYLEVVIETQLFPTVWSYQRLAVHETLENNFRQMLEKRDIPPTSNIGEKMFFDPFARVQTHQHVSVCVAPRPAGRSSLDGPTSAKNYGSLRSVNSPWSSEPAFGRGLSSPTEERGRPSLEYKGRPSLERGRPSLDNNVNTMPPTGQVVTSRNCGVPGIVVLPDTFIPIPEDELYNYASHGAMILNATRLATFTDAHPDVAFEEQQEAWEDHVEKYWTYERSNRLRLGFRMKQFDDDDVPEVSGPTQGRWKWSKCDEDLERPLEIRRFRAWSLTKPTTSR